jgi:hypothetical protein
LTRNQSGFTATALAYPYVLPIIARLG